MAHARLSRVTPAPEMKDPSGGTTGRVKPYGRLGWMGARAGYSRWGGISAPTSICRQGLPRRSKPAGDFFDSSGTALCGRTRLAAGDRRVSPGRLSRTPSAATGGSSAGEGPGSPAILRAGHLSPPALPDIAATGMRLRACRPPETAAKASASPAPNRSSRPGEPRSRAVFVRMARTSSGFSAGLRSSISAASAADISGGKRGARSHLVFVVGRRQEDIRAGRRDARYSRRGSMPRTICPARRWR